MSRSTRCSPSFSRRTRLGHWRHLLDRLCRTCRLTYGDAAEPTSVVIDSRSCRSALRCFGPGFDGGKKINDVEVHLGVNKYGIPLASTSRQPTCMIRKVSSRCSASSPAKASGNLAYRRKRLAKAGRKLGITVELVARSLDGKFPRSDSTGWLNAPSYAFLITDG
jgi:hypothetical protein